MKWLYEELDKKGCTLDRVGILLDVSMGIADEYKDHAMVGSGPVSYTHLQRIIWQKRSATF